jgi:hypothetical protein
VACSCWYFLRRPDCTVTSADHTNFHYLDDRPSKSELPDQTSASSKPESARPSKIIDQSPASRPKSRATVIASGAVPVATPDFPKATGTVFRIPIFVPLFPDPAMLKMTRGYFWSELCLASKSGRVLQSGHINTNAAGSGVWQEETALIGRGKRRWWWRRAVVASAIEFGGVHAEEHRRKEEALQKLRGQGHAQEGRQNREMPEVRRDWDQAFITRPSSSAPRRTISKLWRR